MGSTGGPVTDTDRLGTGSGMGETGIRRVGVPGRSEAADSVVAVERAITYIAYGVATVVLLVFPTAYFAALYKFERGAAEALAHAKARVVSEEIGRVPEVWRFEQQRLDAFARTEVESVPGETRYTIVHADGTVLAAGDDPVDGPSIRASAPLLDSGLVVGSFVVERSIRAELIATAAVTVMSALIAVLIAFVLRQLPLNALRRYRERLEHMAQHDALTGLPNRALLQDRLDQAILRSRRSGTPVTVVYLDLDHFKDVNDTLGHRQGDELLRTVAARMAESMRASDIVARLGGDEFVIVLLDLPGAAEGITPSLERLRAALAQPLQLGDRAIQVTASMGIATFPQDGASADELLMHADAAMYAAKAEGRNGYRFFTGELNARVRRKVELQEGLAHAIERGELGVLYQPQVDLATGRPVGVEALVRWQHPERGLLAPGQFIDFAEDSGHIVALGQWVLRTACRQNAHWQSLGLPPIVVGVNVSAKQFRQADWVRQVEEALRESGLAPRYLELELTESVLMRQPERAIRTLEELAAMGVRLSIDDFGTGYSSLSALRQFPVHTLKIDRCFIADVLSDAGNQSITRAMIALGHRLDMRVLAEGVETQEQLAFLVGNDCDLMQGRLFSPAIDADQVTAMLRRDRASVRFETGFFAPLRSGD
jgi:diguanylate cyclase (GGDEF)-like protein